MGGALRNMIDLGNNKYQNSSPNLECENIYTCLVILIWLYIKIKVKNFN